MNIPSKEYIVEKRCNDKAIKRDYPEFYKYILDNFPCKLFSEKLYWYYNNIVEYPKCICGEDLKFLDFKRGYQIHCSRKCANSNKEKIEKTSKTNLERYNGTGFSSQICRDKGIQTKKYRYGDEKYVGVDKRKVTNLKKYGVEHGLANREVQEKSKQTKLERYGDKYYTNHEKANATKIERYGSIWGENFKRTNLDRLGVEYPFQSKMIQDKIKENNLKKYGSIHPLQNQELLSKSIKTRKNNFIDKHDDILDITDDNIYTCKCPHPNCTMCSEKQFKISSQKYHGRKYRNDELCTILSPGDHNKNTFIENFVKDILNKYNIEYVTNTKYVIPPKELDIYIPSKKIAIECNGVFWHSDKWKDENYHINKYKSCQDNGIQLISVWEDQVYKKPEIIESIILSKLNIYKKIIDSNYFIGYPDSNEYIEFMSSNSISGIYACQIKIGIYHNNELVSVMCFSKTNKDSYILQGYHQKIFVNIVNGLLDLFNYFIQQYNPKIVTGYSSNDLCEDIFENIGFENAGVENSIWYVDNNYDRVRAILKNESTLYKINDSGQTKWIFYNKN